MAEQKIKTRIQHKHDFEANWVLAENFIPLAGELIIYDKEVDSDGNILDSCLKEGEPNFPEGRTAPCCYDRFKTGDGVTKINKLPFNQAVYTNPDPVLNTIGGINSSNRANGFDNVPITEILTELLYPYTVPVVGSLSLSPAAGVKEKRYPIILESASISVTKKSKPISKVDLYKGSTTIQSKTPTTSSSAVTVSFTDLNDLLTGDSNVTYTAKVSEKNGVANLVERSATYTFVNPYYTGVIEENTELTDALITGLTKKVESKGTKKSGTSGWPSYTTTSTQCAVIAYPASYGDLKIVDQNNFTQNWSRSEVSLLDVRRVSTYSDLSTITTYTDMIVYVKDEDKAYKFNGSSWAETSDTLLTVKYYVYVSGAAAADNFKYTFSY